MEVGITCFLILVSVVWLLKLMSIVKETWKEGDKFVASVLFVISLLIIREVLILSTAVLGFP